MKSSTWCAAFICVMLSGCATPPNPQHATALKNPVPAAQRQHEARAATFAKRGELVSALTEWNILSVLIPNHPRYVREAAAITTRIDARVRELLRNGHGAINRGDHNAARVSLLQALALRPRDHEAMTLLRQLEQDSALRDAQAKMNTYFFSGKYQKP